MQLKGTDMSIFSGLTLKHHIARCFYKTKNWYQKQIKFIQNEDYQTISNEVSFPWYNPHKFWFRIRKLLDRGIEPSSRDYPSLNAQSLFWILMLKIPRPFSVSKMFPFGVFIYLASIKQRAEIAWVNNRWTMSVRDSCNVSFKEIVDTKNIMFNILGTISNRNFSGRLKKNSLHIGQKLVKT